MNVKNWGIFWLLIMILGAELACAGYPQDHFSYLEGLDAEKELISRDEQFLFADFYLTQHFLPWRTGGYQYDAGRVRAFFRTYLEKINRASPSRKRERRIEENAELFDYPGLHIRAITTDRIDVLGLPYRAKRGNVINLALQASSVPRGTPLLVTHLSRDRKWYFVESGFVCGWVKEKYVALVDEKFTETWERGPFAVIMKDGENFRIGEIYPVREIEGNWYLLIPKKNRRGKAYIASTHFAREQTDFFPLPLTYKHLATVANYLTDKPYGWGGVNGLRDCSSLMRDLFTPFGIWLPRHSLDQASEGGKFIDLSGMGREKKLATIAAKAIPYLTLLWIKGHVMLYIGHKEGQPMVFHSFRRAIVETPNGGFKEEMVGRSQITPLGRLIESVRGMVIIAKEGER